MRNVIFAINITMDGCRDHIPMNPDDEVLEYFTHLTREADLHGLSRSTLYIDYLARNSEDMARIHWRDFERLTTEFFRRQGYEVDLSRGTKDGGVDVRVWTDKDSKTGPPLMLIQCKRYKDVVGIETVKAFWSDVHFEGAEKGLIATTSSVSRDSNRLCEVRKWPMGFAEAAEIQKWARTMWRHAPAIRDDE